MNHYIFDLDDTLLVHRNDINYTLIRENPELSHYLNQCQGMRYIYTMQNMTFGTDGGLTKACQDRYPNEPGLCFMSPHMQNFIETPFFMFNSKYDLWQLTNELQDIAWKTDPGVRQRHMQPARAPHL